MSDKKALCHISNKRMHKSHLFVQVTHNSSHNLFLFHKSMKKFMHKDKLIKNWIRWMNILEQYFSIKQSKRHNSKKEMG